MSVLLSKSLGHSMLVDTLKIADFFLCFSTRLENIKPPNSVKGMRGRCNRVVKGLKQSQFEVLPSSEVLFNRMDVIQETAISAMCSRGIFEIYEAETDRRVSLNQEKMPIPLSENMNGFVSLNTELVNLLAVDFNEIQVRGANGLKARTGLGDYVYDTV